MRLLMTSTSKSSVPLFLLNKAEHDMILTVARKEFREIIRDGRIKWSALILAVMLVAALGTAGQRFADISAERAAAQEVVNMQFAAQGEKKPTRCCALWLVRL